MKFDEIMRRVQEHYNEALNYFPENNIVGIFLQGSQNYGLDDSESDVDTKLIVTPTLSDIVLARGPVSTTHIRENNEHIDFKDIRLMFNCFKKQNLNFVEILFTNYLILNPLYEQEFGELLRERNLISRYNDYLAVKAMKGVALEKYHALEHRYPSRVAIIDKFGYDPKQLGHLMRVRKFLEKFIQGVPYSFCMVPNDINYMIAVKRGCIPYKDMRSIADHELELVNKICAPYTKDSEYNVTDERAEFWLNKVQEEIMIKSVKKELGL